MSKSNYSYNGYTPKQGDIIYIDFDPSVGREIQKRRPAIVMSSDGFNQKTGYIAICPITSTIRKSSLYIGLNSKRVHGQIVAVQFRTIDFTSPLRNVEFVEISNPIDFMKTAELITNSFGFNQFIDNI